MKSNLSELLKSKIKTYVYPFDYKEKERIILYAIFNIDTFYFS